MLVPAGAHRRRLWALYEKWTLGEHARARRAATTLARFDTGFGVFNPSRYAERRRRRSGARSPLCRETAADGDRADGVDCSRAAAARAVNAFDDPRSPFDGTRRDVYLAGTTVDNAGGAGRYWTDPYGGNASPTPFPGGVCQLVSTTDNGGQRRDRRRSSGATAATTRRASTRRTERGVSGL